MRSQAALIISVLLVATLCLPSPLLAKERASTKQCASWERQYIKVNQQLRDGYTAKQGYKLRKKRRRLADKIRQHCK